MPCRYDPGPEDYLRTEKQKVEILTNDLDRLTHENDQLREALLNLINDRDYTLPAPVVEVINAEQVEHRKNDLKRLEKTFRDIVDVDQADPEHYEYLGRIVTADPTKPLEPQLGFDPDEF